MLEEMCPTGTSASEGLKLMMALKAVGWILLVAQCWMMCPTGTSTRQGLKLDGRSQTVVYSSIPAHRLLIRRFPDHRCSVEQDK